MSKKQKYFTVRADIRNASGWQEWKVKASSAIEALEKWRSGYDSEFVDEEVEIMLLEEPEVIDEEEITPKAHP